MHVREDISGEFFIFPVRDCKAEPKLESSHSVHFQKIFIGIYCHKMTGNLGIMTGK